MRQIFKVAIESKSHKETSMFFWLLIGFRFVVNDPGTVDLLKHIKNQKDLKQISFIKTFECGWIEYLYIPEEVKATDTYTKLFWGNSVTTIQVIVINYDSKSILPVTRFNQASSWL